MLEAVMGGLCSFKTTYKEQMLLVPRKIKLFCMENAHLGNSFFGLLYISKMIHSIFANVYYKHSKYDAVIKVPESGKVKFESPSTMEVSWVINLPTSQGCSEDKKEQVPLVPQWGRSQGTN